MGRPTLRTFARVGVTALGLTLIVSALAKSLAPETAAAGLLWSHLAHARRMELVVVACFLESAVGGLLLMRARNRVVLWIASCLAGLLLVLHAIGLAHGALGCGCFGAVAVPDVLTLTLLAVGLASCGVAVRDARARWSWMSASLVLVLALTMPALTAALHRSTASAVDELRHELGISPSARAVVLVGSWSCEDCRRALRENGASLASGERFLFVTRSSEARPDDAPAGSYEHASIPDRLWWRLVVPEPPRLVRLEPDYPPPG